VVKGLAGLAVILAACGAKTSGAVEDAKRSPPHGDATSDPPRDAAAPATGGKGYLAVRVEWHDVPVAMRTSPARASCGTPKSPVVAPTTTWGIPDVFVAIDAPYTGEERAARIVVGECAASPRVAVGDYVALASTAPAPVKAVLTKRGELRAGTVELHDGAATTILLPITGHEARFVLDANSLYELAANGDSAWILSASAAITDASGVATFRDTPSGSRAVYAFLPPRGAKAMGNGASAGVTAGALAEVTIQLAPPP
jgi:hypothetical protein